MSTERKLSYPRYGIWDNRVFVLAYHLSDSSCRKLSAAGALVAIITRLILSIALVLAVSPAPARSTML